MRQSERGGSEVRGRETPVELQSIYGEQRMYSWLRSSVSEAQVFMTDSIFILD